MLTGIPPAPRSTPQIEVGFDIDANGIMSVSAKDLATGRKQGITITAANKLSKDEVQKMIRQAEEFAASDRGRAELVTAKNQAESLAYEAERVLTESKDKIAEADATDVRAKVASLREALQAPEPTVSQIQAQTDALTKALHAIAQKLYQSAAASAQGGAPTGAPPTPPDHESSSPTGEEGSSQSGPVDADFKVVDDGGKEPGSP